MFSWIKQNDNWKNPNFGQNNASNTTEMNIQKVNRMTKLDYKMQTATENKQIMSWNRTTQNVFPFQNIFTVKNNYIPFNIWTSTVADVELIIEHEYMPLCCRSALNIDKRLMIQPPFLLFWMRQKKQFFVNCRGFRLYSY